MNTPVSSLATPIDENRPVFPLWNQAVAVAVLTILALLGIMTIRTLALRVTQYQVSVYEGYVQDAMSRGAYARAVEICTGAIRASVNTQAHWGRAWQLRAEAHRQAGQLEAALADLQNSRSFFQQRYYFAEDTDRARIAATGTELARNFLERNDGAGALEAFGIAAAESGQPVDYLRRLNESLAPHAREMLWGDGKPSITLRDFSAPEGDERGLEVVVEQQGRQVMASSVDRAVKPAAALLELGPATESGRSAYAAATWMPITTGNYSIRLTARAEGPMPQGLLSFWFESARESIHVLSSEWEEAGDGWQQCTIGSAMHERIAAGAQQRGFSPHDGILFRAGFEFSPESASKVWLAKVDLVLE
jgi:hypothetical protein